MIALVMLFTLFTKSASLIYLCPLSGRQSGLVLRCWPRKMNKYKNFSWICVLVYKSAASLVREAAPSQRSVSGKRGRGSEL